MLGLIGLLGVYAAGPGKNNQTSKLTRKQISQQVNTVYQNLCLPDNQQATKNMIRSWLTNKPVNRNIINKLINRCDCDCSWTSNGCGADDGSECWGCCCD